MERGVGYACVFPRAAREDAFAQYGIIDTLSETDRFSVASCEIVSQRVFVRSINVIFPFFGCARV
jgi:hypothetical protein